MIARGLLFLLVGPLWGFFALSVWAALLLPFTIGKMFGWTSVTYWEFTRGIATGWGLFDA
jgi:hypothetical protein